MFQQSDRAFPPVVQFVGLCPPMGGMEGCKAKLQWSAVKMQDKTATIAVSGGEMLLGKRWQRYGRPCRCATRESPP